MKFGIIAAGEGSRLKSEGLAVSKPLVEIDGLPMIWRLLKIFESCRAESVSILLNSKMEDASDFLNRFIPSLSMPVYVTKDQPPSSFHSFSRLSEIMKPEGKFIVTTVDTVFNDEAFQRYVRTFEDLDEDVDGLMAVTRQIDDEKPLYVSVGNNGVINGFSDSPAEGINFISAGIYGLTPSCFPVLDNAKKMGMARMRNFQREMIAEGLKLLPFDLGPVIDVDHLQDIEKARFLMSETEEIDFSLTK